LASCKASTKQEANTSTSLLLASCKASNKQEANSSTSAIERFPTVRLKKGLELPARQAAN
jgi:hypothetical protein